MSNYQIPIIQTLQSWPYLSFPSFHIPSHPFPSSPRLVLSTLSLSSAPPSHTRPNPRSILIAGPLDATEPKVLLPTLAPAVTKLLVELFDRAQTRHVLGDAGADLLQRFIEVALVQRAFRGECVGLPAHEVEGYRGWLGS